MKESEEKMDFQADVNRVMDIIINSVQQNKDIFLREVISNASDASNKIRQESLKDETILGKGDLRELNVQVEYDEEAKTLTVTDRGIGMTKKQMVDNLGTVARSGTTSFLEKMQSEQDSSSDLIGKFGVGFQSVFLIADKVEVTSKHNSDDQYVWTSDAAGTFAVAKDPRGDTLGRGTRVRLHLKPDTTEYLKESVLEETIKKYSEFVAFPIQLRRLKTKTREVPTGEFEQVKGESSKGESKGEKDDTEISDDDSSAKVKKPKMKTESYTVWEWERINTQKPIWTRDRKSITDDEYKRFYKSMTKDWQDPVAWTHFKAEGDLQFTAILFVPPKQQNQFQQEDSDVSNQKSKVKLFVRRVMIAEEFEDLLPKYMSFIKGIVDSDDLPLTVSRENLVKMKSLKVMGKKLTRKVIEMLRDLAEPVGSATDDDDDDDEEGEDAPEPELGEAELKTIKEKKDKQKNVWNLYGNHVKFGVIQDPANRSKLSNLVRFHSTNDPEEYTSFKDQVKRMREGQEFIQQMCGDSRDALYKSPMIQQLRKRKYEVALLDQPIDEFAVNNLTEFEGTKLKNVAKGDLKFGDETELERKKEKQMLKDFEPLTKWMKDVLGNDVERVTLSKRLVDEPCVVTSDDQGFTANMERVQKAQALNNEVNEFMKARRILEINPHHPVIQRLLADVAAFSDATRGKNPKEEDLAFLLYQSAASTSGFAIKDTNTFADRMQRAIRRAIGVDLEAKTKEWEVVLPKEDGEGENGAATKGEAASSNTKDSEDAGDADAKKEDL